MKNVSTNYGKRCSNDKGDENIQKYKDLKHEVNTIIRNINIKFDFRIFTYEELQHLETVRKAK